MAGVAKGPVGELWVKDQVFCLTTLDYSCKPQTMLLKSWIKEITRVECRPEAQTVNCIARLDENIGEVIPYLNAVLGGYSYIKEAKR